MAGEVPCCAGNGRMAVGGSCPDCGHTSMLHPGNANSHLMCCVVCEVVILRDQLGEALAAVRGLHEALQAKAARTP